MRIGVVTAYTSEQGSSQYQKSSWKSAPESSSCPPTGDLYGYKNPTGTTFNLNGHYYAPDPYGDDLFLFYDGHTGYDYPVPDGTSIYAAASGIAHPYTGAGGAYDVFIDHQNGYYTYYLHLSARLITDGQTVNTSTIIGQTGSGHLHFTVKKGTQRVDPYGWKGAYGTDPLQVDSHDNVCLWATCQ
ncbi:MAG TPA: M23 family metallopeptidase [Candidatus Paceibacterota bacterium]